MRRDFFDSFNVNLSFDTSLLLPERLVICRTVAYGVLEGSRYDKRANILGNQSYYMCTLYYLKTRP